MHLDLQAVVFHYRFFSSDLGGFYDWAYYGSAAVSDCAFIGNGAEDPGGAIYSLDAEMSFARANFTANAAGVDGGALYYTVDGADAPRPRKPPTAVNEASAHGRAAAVAAHVSLFRDGDAPGTSATPALFVDPPPPDLDDVVIAPRPSFSEAQVDLHYDDSSAPPLSGDEIVQLVVLGYTRADAETVAPTEGRRFIHAAQGWDDHFEESP